MNILSVDVGTTSIRGVLFSQGGNYLASHAVNTPLQFLDGFIEQIPSVFTDSLLEIIRHIQKSFEIDAISLTAFRSAPALVNREGQPLSNFIMWQDKRNKEICDALSPSNQEIHSICGAGVNTVFTAGKIAWFKKNMPDVYSKAYKAVVVPDYLTRFMTGNFVTDYTYGSRTLLMDIKKMAWNSRLCELFDVDMDKLCKLVPQGSVVGYTTAAFSRSSGVREGIPVISAGGDQQCGALGLGVTDTSRLSINNGTGSFILCLTDEPVLSVQSVICNVAAVPGKYTLESNVLTSASAINWAMETIFADLKKDGAPDYKAFDLLSQSAPPGANGLCFFPLFQGCGTRHWNPEIRASLGGMSLSTTRADIARSIYEGISAEIVRSLAFMPFEKTAVQEISLAGGLSQSDVFNQILCDMLGLPLVRYQNKEATALGAFVSAAVALRLYPGYDEALKAVRTGDEITRYTPSPDLTAAYRDYLDTSGYLFRQMNQA